MKTLERKLRKEREVLVSTSQDPMDGEWGCEADFLVDLFITADRADACKFASFKYWDIQWYDEDADVVSFYVQIPVYDVLIETKGVPVISDDWDNAVYNAINGICKVSKLYDYEVIDFTQYE